jgi:hypothetical protein
MGTDRMMPRYVFHKPFKVHITSMNGRMDLIQIIKEA